jgi:23S rRNA (adenine2030-N6)-methyltransferase
MTIEPMSSIDYSHHYHAGNVGDVWKHCLLVACLDALPRPSTVCYVETHAGGGLYHLGPTGEWTEGVGKLASEGQGLPRAVARYLEVLRGRGFCDAPAGRVYPGSPVIALSLLGERDRALLFELQRPTCDALREHVGVDRRAVVEEGDGLAALRRCLADGEPVERFVMIDPPYVAKSEWTVVPDALVEAWRARPDARFMLWYPIKSFTRPDAMLRRLRSSGMPATALDLVTTPLDLRRNRLNGSGVLLVNAPPGVLAAAAAAAPIVGAACATHEGRWLSRGTAWGEPARRFER